MEKLITRKEAAKLLGISLATLDEARNSGLISYIQYVPMGAYISLLPTFRNMLLNAPIGQNLWKRKQPTEMCEETNRTFEQIVRFW